MTPIETSACTDGVGNNTLINPGGWEGNLECLMIGSDYLMINWYSWGNPNCPALMPALIYSDPTQYTVGDTITWSNVTPTADQLSCGPNFANGITSYEFMMEFTWYDAGGNVVCNEFYTSIQIACSTSTPVTYNCEPLGCVDPLDGSGTYSGPTALADCQSICTPLGSFTGYECDQTTGCYGVTTPFYTFNTLADCQASCITITPSPCPLVENYDFTSQTIVSSVYLGCIGPNPCNVVLGQEVLAAISSVTGAPSNLHWTAWMIDPSGTSGFSTPQVVIHPSIDIPNGVLTMGSNSASSPPNQSRSGVYQLIDNLIAGQDYRLSVEVLNLTDPNGCGAYGSGGANAGSLLIEGGIWFDANATQYIGLGGLSGTAVLPLSGTYPETVTWDFTAAGSPDNEVLALSLWTECEQTFEIGSICIEQI